MLTNSSRISPPAFCDPRKSAMGLPSHRSHLKRLFRLIAECVPRSRFSNSRFNRLASREDRLGSRRRKRPSGFGSDSFSPARFVGWRQKCFGPVGDERRRRHRSRAAQPIRKSPFRTSRRSEWALMRLSAFIPDYRQLSTKARATVAPQHCQTAPGDDGDQGACAPSRQSRSLQQSVNGTPMPSEQTRSGDGGVAKGRC